MTKILIAGASGFIGRALIERLLQNEDLYLVGLSRSPRKSYHPRFEWKVCDLFSLKDISFAMKGCREAYYLVHSMLPSASLSQGTFYDFDLIMADNFVRAGLEHNLEHIIYLGGMIPPEKNLSWHLKSRLEVEETFRHSSIKTTVFRAGLIVGPDGSSFKILQKLIERLPLMICPAWTKTRSQPVVLDDVIRVLCKIQNEKKLQGRIFDVAGPEVVTYQDLILQAAKKIKKSTRLVTLNVIPLRMSRFWVSLVTGVPKDLVYPLVLSLRHEMLPSPQQEWPYQEDLSTSLEEGLTKALGISSKITKSYRPPQKDVRSVQRLILPPGKDAQWVAQEYFNWLPTFFSSLVKVKVESDICTFYLIHPSLKILILNKSRERSTKDRQLLYVVGGKLSGKMDRGRLEFREVLDHQFVIAALHEFRPALPWYLYRWTQAIIHVMVMMAFSEHLKWHFISQKRGLK